MNLLFIIDDINNNDNLYLGRLLILLKEFSGKRGNQTIDNFSKLAQLDFLMSHPTYLEQGLIYRKTKSDLKIEEYERLSIDAKTTYYCYRPWEEKYRILVNILVAKDLVSIELEEHKFKISLTEKGIDIAESIAGIEDYSKEKIRAKKIYSHFKLSSTKLMEFMYDNFPELSTLAVSRSEVM